MDMPPVIDLSGICKTFGAKIAVRDLSLQVEQGTTLALLGRNGAGKTTTINMLLGVTTPTQGQLTVLGGRPSDKAVRERLGAMMQEVSVIDRLRVDEAVEMVRGYYRRPLPLSTLLEWSGLAPHRKLWTQALSGGQKRRLSFALALAGDPELLFLDEPTAGMDIESRQRFWATIEELKSGGKTMILTTHHMEEAERIADRVAVMDEGTLKMEGTLDEIRRVGARRTLTFLAAEGCTSERLSELAGDASQHWDGRKVTLTADDTDRLLYALIGAGVQMREIEVSAGGLEQALQQIWGTSGSAEDWMDQEGVSA